MWMKRSGCSKEPSRKRWRANIFPSEALQLVEKGGGEGQMRHDIFKRHALYDRQVGVDACRGHLAKRLAVLVDRCIRPGFARFAVRRIGRAQVPRSGGISGRRGGSSARTSARH